MSQQKSPRFFLISGYADSVLRFRGHLIDALLAAGLEVHVAAPGIRAAQAVSTELQARGVIVHDLPLERTGMNIRSDIRAMWHFFWMFRRYRPQTVLAYMNKPVLYGLTTAALAGVPGRFALMTGLGFAFQEDSYNSRISRVIRGLYRIALATTSKVFFQNPDDEALMRTSGLLPPRIPSVVVNGSGVEISEYRVCPLPEQPVFLMIARLLKEKGVREYVAAATALKKKYPQVRCLLVGSPDDHPSSIRTEELDRWRSEAVIEYLGQLPDVRPAMASAGVYVLPSYYREGIPRSILEALSMGRAVITTDSPGCRETVQPGINGTLVTPKSVESLLSAMEQLVLQPQLIQQMGAASRQLAERKFDVHAVNAVMLAEMGVAG